MVHKSGLLESIGAGFFTGRMSFLSPKQQHQSTEVEIAADGGGGGGGDDFDDDN